MNHFFKKAAALMIAAALCTASVAAVYAEGPDESEYAQDAAEDAEGETEAGNEDAQDDDDTEPEDETVTEDPGDETPQETAGGDDENDGSGGGDENTDEEPEGGEDETPGDDENEGPGSESENTDEEPGDVEDETQDPGGEETELTKEEEALQILSEIEALAGGYDITAGTVSVESDLEASFQTDLYSNEGGHIIGGSEKYTADENEDNDIISIGSIAEGTDSVRAEHTIETTIILDSDIAADGLTITVTDETGSVVSASEENGTLVIEDDIAGNVAEILDAVEELAVELASLDADTEIERIDQNTEIIDAASVEASVVIAELETVEGWTETDEDGNETVVEKLNYQSGMTVYLTEDQIVVINVTTSDACDKVIVTRFTIDIDGASFSSASQGEENSQAASQIVFNFGDYDGEIYIDSGFTGIIIAPNATVTVGSTSTGQVIADTFSNPGGEWHGTGEGSNSSSSPREDGTSEDPGDEGGQSPAPEDITPSDGPSAEETGPENGTPENDSPEDTDEGNETPDGGDETPGDDNENEPSGSGDENPDDDDEDKISDEEDEPSGKEDGEASDDEDEVSDDEEETSESSGSPSGGETSSGSGESSGQDASSDEDVTDTGTETHEEYGSEDDGDEDETVTDTGTETHTEEGRDGYTGDDGFGPWPWIMAAAAAALAALTLRVKKQRT